MSAYKPGMVNLRRAKDDKLHPSFDNSLRSLSIEKERASTEIAAKRFFNKVSFMLSLRIHSRESSAMDIAHHASNHR